MPILFLSSGDSQGSYSSLGGGADSWEDLAKFLVGARALRRPPRGASALGLTLRLPFALLAARTGFSAVSTVGIPLVLMHAALISGAQLALALPSALLLAGTAVAYGMLSRGDDDVGYGYVYGY